MPTKIQNESAFRLRRIVIAALVLAGAGYLGGALHMQAIAAPQPCPAVSTLEHTREP